MNYVVRFTRAACDDVLRLFARLVDHDAAAARRAREKIAGAAAQLRQFPFNCRQAAIDTPQLRELTISFSGNGYVALFDIDNTATVTVLAVRHLRPDGDGQVGVHHVDC